MRYIIHRKVGKKNIVIFKFAALYYWLMWPTIIATMFAVPSKSLLMYAISGILWFALISLSIPYWSTISELKRMMKDKSITMKGSKYSLSNPLNYEYDD